MKNYKKKKEVFSFFATNYHNEIKSLKHKIHYGISHNYNVIVVEYIKERQGNQLHKFFMAPLALKLNKKHYMPVWKFYLISVDR